MINLVGSERVAELDHVLGAAAVACLGLRRTKACENNDAEQGNDRDDDHDFDEGESLLR